jgi:hypothetical protein
MENLKFDMMLNKIESITEKWRNLDLEVHNAFFARLSKMEMKKCVTFCYMWITEESQRITIFCHVVGLSCLLLKCMP